MRRALCLNEDDLLLAETTKAGILLRPVSLYPTELYTEERLAVFEEQNNQSIADVFPDKRGVDHDE